VVSEGLFVLKKKIKMSLKLNLKEEPFVFEVKNEDGAICLMDGSPDIGGKNKGLRPMQLLASSIAGCASIDILLILRKQRIEPTHFSIDIETKRVDEVPAIFEEVKLIFSLNKEVNKEKLERAIKLTLEKYCSVSSSLKEEVNVIFETKFI
jgi:putative redox protein